MALIPIHFASIPIHVGADEIYFGPSRGLNITQPLLKRAIQISDGMAEILKGSSDNRSHPYETVDPPDSIKEIVFHAKSAKKRKEEKIFDGIYRIDRILFLDLVDPVDLVKKGILPPKGDHWLSSFPFFSPLLPAVMDGVAEERSERNILRMKFIPTRGKPRMEGFRVGMRTLSILINRSEWLEFVFHTGFLAAAREKEDKKGYISICHAR